MTNNQKKFGIAIIAAIICAVAFYFLYWIKTPVYSLGIIRDSIQKHDVATFEKHVDLDTLYAKGFDDAFIAYDKLQGDNLMSNPLAVGFVQMMKPAVVSGLKTKTLDSIKGEDDAAQAKALLGDSEQVVKDLKKSSGIDDSTFRDASVASSDGNEAIVAIKVHNNKIDKDFDLKVKMSKLDDGTWKVKELTNLVDFMLEVDAATKAKIAELNKPIQEKIQNFIAVTDTKLKFHFSHDWFSAYYSFNYGATLKNISDQKITGFSVKYIFKDQKGVACKEVVQPYGTKVLAPNEEITLTQTLRLNASSANDKKLISNPDKCSIVVEVKWIKFEDGTTIQMLDKLPD